MLINRELLNKKTATEFGIISFNENGECNELTVAQQQKLGALKGFEYKADKIAPKKEEPKVAEPKAAELKKAPTRKSTSKKKAVEPKEN